MRDLERYIVLQVVDIRWREHLENMDYMREGIHLRGMAQKDPLVEYRNEGHIMFIELNHSIREEVIALLFHAQVEAGPTDERRRWRRRSLPQPGGNGGGPNGNLTYEHESLAGADAIAAAGGGAALAAGLGGGGGRRGARRSRPSSSPTTRTSAATTRAGAGRARSTSAATARDRARAPLVGTSICLDPITVDDAGDLDWLARDEDVRRFTRVPSEPRRRLRRRVGRAVRAGLGGRQPRRLRDPRSRRRRSSASRCSSQLDREAREGEIGYVVGPSGARPRCRHRGGRLLTRWGFDELDLERIDAADRRRRTTASSASPSAAATRARASCARCT